MIGQAWPVVRWVLFAQLVLAAVAAAITALITDWIDGLFVVLGGLAAMALAGIFALRAFAVDASADPRGALGAFARAEAMKLVAAVIFFVLVAQLAPGRFGPIIIGFCAATLSYFLALPFAGGREMNKLD